MKPVLKMSERQELKRLFRIVESRYSTLQDKRMAMRKYDRLWESAVKRTYYEKFTNKN